MRGSWILIALLTLGGAGGCSGPGAVSASEPATNPARVVATAPSGNTPSGNTPSGNTPRPPPVAPTSARKPTTNTTPAPVTGESESCLIKGNISVATGEKIYHVPGQRDYEKTVITQSKGERWFCSEAEAVAAGWRKSKV
jgi:hypothetical protein